VTGAVILGVTASLPYLFAAAITGFLLVAPMLAAGLYELSRRYLAGEPATLSTRCGLEAQSLGPGQLRPALDTGRHRLAGGLGGDRRPVLQGPPLAPMAMMIEVLVNPQHYLMFFIYMVRRRPARRRGVRPQRGLDADAGRPPLRPALRAGHQRQCRRRESAAAGAVGAHHHAADRLGFATALVGLVLVMPWLGHASFHAYKDLVE
jgi:hypothetical protein